MKDITEYFRSPTKMVSPTTTASSSVQSSPLTSSTDVVAMKMSRSSSATLHSSQPLKNATKPITKKASSGMSDVALIVSNMKSVISSVNHHKHRKRRKHRGISNNGKRGPTGTSNSSQTVSTNEPTEISDISNILSNSLSFHSPNCSNNSQISELLGKADSIPILKSSPNNNALSSISLLTDDKNTTTHQSLTDTDTTDANKITASLAKHQNRSPKKRHSKENNSRKVSRKDTKKCIDRKTNETSSICSSSSSSSSSQTQQCNDKLASITQKKNAFDLMMSARNKVIGSNSPASANKIVSLSPPIVVDTTKIKRKLMLEDWADRKGGEKRKMQDIEESAYIEQQMNRRTKRLKRLLQNGHGRKSDNVFEKEDDATEDTPFIKLNFKKKTTKNKKSSIKSTVTTGNCISSNLNSTLSDKYKPLEIVVTTKKSTEVKLSPEPSVHMDEAATSPVKAVDTHSQHGLSGDADFSLLKTDNSFINKLSSPIKKRDSLLGYFNKVTKTPSPQLAAVEINRDIGDDDDTLNNNDNDLVEVLIIIEGDRASENKTNINKRNPKENKKVDKLLISPSKVSRPKRQCRAKMISYRQEPLPPSPAKICAKKSLKRARRILSVSSCSGGDSSPVKSKSTNVVVATTAKLAPIFCAKLPKPVEDLERMQARQNFLMSGIPEKMKLDIERQRQYEETFECDAEIFPLVSHITQLNDSETRRRWQQQQPAPSIKFRMELDEDDVSHKMYEKFVCGRYRTKILATTNTKLLNHQTKQCVVEPNFSIQKKLIRHLKNKDLTKFLYFRCYKQLRKKYLHAKMMMNKGENSSTSEVILLNDDSDDLKKIEGEEEKDDEDDDDDGDDNDDDDVQFISDTSNILTNFTNNKSTASNGIMLFTEKYQPKSSDEILVNSAPALQLKKFLSTWQESNMVSSSARRTNKGRYYYDSSEDSDDDAFSSNSGLTGEQQQQLRKAVCLLGPPGCGKTMTVYALANELNFKVLEINAGCKRTGKKILQELQEATQSHHVKGNGASADKFFKITQTSQSDESNSFTGGAVSGTPTSGSISTNKSSSQKLSLILIEDADIVFDQDFGFIEAISQLITTSKRPVILALNQQNCVHLAKFLAHNTIHFSPPNPEQIGRWLSTVSIVENCYVKAIQCQQLYEKNGNDLRKTILDLQFFVQTFGDKITINNTTTKKKKNSQMLEHKSFNDTFKNNNPHSHIPCPVDFNLIANHSIDLYCQKNIENCSLNELTNFYDKLSTTQVLQRKQSSSSSSLVYDGLVINTGEGIIQSIIEKLIPADSYRRNDTNLLATESLQKNTTFPKKLLAENILSSISIPNGGGGGESGLHTNKGGRRKSINVDVEPCLRAICRSEQFRTQLDQRSSRRFYHYLRNSMTTSFSLDVFDEHCTIFQSKNKNMSSTTDLVLENYEDSNTDAHS